MLSVVGAYEYEGGTPQFCEKNYVRAKVRFTKSVPAMKFVFP